MQLKNIQWFNSPIKHAILENPIPSKMASYLHDNFPKHEFDKYVDNDEVWKDFYELVINSLKNLISLCDKNFDIQVHRHLKIEVKHWDYSSETVDLVRDWHTDVENKKYQLLFYLGDTNEGGSLEMKNENHPVIKHIPFKHNRLIIWPVNDRLYNFPRSLHRFYSGIGSRKTINFKLLY